MKAEGLLVLARLARCTDPRVPGAGLEDDVCRLVSERLLGKAGRGTGRRVGVAVVLRVLQQQQAAGRRPVPSPQPNTWPAAAHGARLTVLRGVHCGGVADA